LINSNQQNINLKINKTLNLDISTLSNSNSVISNSELEGKINTYQKINSKNTIFKQAISMLGTCNSVSPTEIDDTRSLQASSPDEIAFVVFTDSIGYFMKSRSSLNINFEEK